MIEERVILQILSALLKSLLRRQRGCDFAVFFAIILISWLLALARYAVPLALKGSLEIETRDEFAEFACFPEGG